MLVVDLSLHRLGPLHPYRWHGLFCLLEVGVVVSGSVGLLVVDVDGKCVGRGWFEDSLVPRPQQKAPMDALATRSE